MQRAHLQDKVVIITGGSRGIGYATAQMALQEGARVALCARDPDNLARATESLNPLGPVYSQPADTSRFVEMEQLVEATKERFGRVDLLVNNAGVAWAGEFAEQPVETIDAIVEVNIKGVLYGCRTVLPTMLAQGTGTIVNVSSGAGHTGIPRIASYCASKFAVNGLTESLAREVKGQGISVYGVCPGRVATEMQREVSGRIQGISPERVARAILSLAAPNPPLSPGRCLDL